MNIKNSICKLVILVYLCLNNLPVSAIENPKIGSRATAMGGNYRSIASDWSAMYYNPAGLSFMKGWSAGLSLEYVMLRSTFKAGHSLFYNENGGEHFRPFSATYNTKREMEPLNFLVPSFGISYSPEGKWAFGLGMWVSMGLGTKWDLLDTDGNVNGRGVYNIAYPKFEYENTVEVFDLHPTVSYRINDRLSLGIGISIIFGKIEIRRPAFLQNPYLYDEDIYRIVLDYSDPTQTETLNQMRLPPFDHLVNEVEMKGTGATFGANAGFMYKPGDKWSIGAAIQINEDLDISGDYKQTAYFGDNKEYNTLTEYYDERLFSRLLQIGLDEQSHLIISEFYSGKVISLEDTKATTKVPLPMKLGLGISYSGIKNLTLAADINFMEWSDWDTFLVVDENNDSISALIQNWENAIKIGIGAEYESEMATFRAGFSKDNNTAVDETISPSIPEIGNRYNLDVGIAFNLLGGQLALNYERIFIAEHTVKNWNYDHMMIALNMAGTYTMKINTLMIGYEYKF